MALSQTDHVVSRISSRTANGYTFCGCSIRFHFLHISISMASLPRVSAYRYKLPTIATRMWQSRFHCCTNGGRRVYTRDTAAEHVPGEATVLTFRHRAEPSTCRGLRLMSLIFRTESARVALMSRGRRAWCPRRLVRHPPSVWRTSRSTKGRGTESRIGPGWIALARTRANRTNNRKGCGKLTDDARDGRTGIAGRNHPAIPLAVVVVAVVPDICAKKTKRGGSPLSPPRPPRWNETDIALLNGAREEARSGGEISPY